MRINLPFMTFFVDPVLAGTAPSVLIAGNDPAAREAVAGLVFDMGLDPPRLDGGGGYWQGHGDFGHGP